MAESDSHAFCIYAYRSIHLMKRGIVHYSKHDWDPLTLLQRTINKAYAKWLNLTYPFETFGSRISIQFPCLIDKRVSRYIALGDAVIIRKDTWLNILASEDPCVRLTIGNHCCIGARNQISVKNRVCIENNVITASAVLIQDHNHAYEDVDIPIRDQGVTEGGTILIEEGSWIGHGAAIVCSRGNLVIGRHCVIAANAVVTRSAPPYSVLAGNPARVVRQYDSDLRSWVRLSQP